MEKEMILDQKEVRNIDKDFEQLIQTRRDCIGYFDILFTRFENVRDTFISKLKADDRSVVISTSVPEDFKITSLAGFFIAWGDIQFALHLKVRLDYDGNAFGYVVMVNHTKGEQDSSTLFSFRENGMTTMSDENGQLISCRDNNLPMSILRVEAGRVDW
jgi:hypothetical protein